MNIKTDQETSHKYDMIQLSIVIIIPTATMMHGCKNDSARPRSSPVW